MQTELLDLARTYFPGGTFGVNLPEHLRTVMVRGKGSRIRDANGKEYIDYLLGSGPLLVGHAHPEVVAAVQRQAALASTFYMLNEPAILLAQKIVDAVPCGGTLRYQLSGTDATFSALRIARAATGRKHVVKFEGAFHGSHDVAQVSVEIRPRSDHRAPAAVRDTTGIPESVVDEVLVAQFNDLQSVAQLVQARGDGIAAIIVEPLQRVLKPLPGFLEGLRALCSEHGIVLIFDEVVTGFRIAWGGAQELYGVTPDLACYSKTIGGGYPVSAVVGRKDLLDLTVPGGDNARYCYVAGTLSGNPVAAAAGLAALNILDRPGVYDRLRCMGNLLRSEIEAAGSRAGLPVRALGDGPIVQVVFSERAEFVTAQHLTEIDHARTLRFGHEMISRGIYFTPKGKMYISLAHTDADLDETLETIGAVLRDLQ
jgi:glutamate-1-semialdehyde 2,1-aminomutase